MIEIIRENSIYRHIHGQEAKVIAVATLTETNEQIVVYKWLGTDETKKNAMEFLQNHFMNSSKNLFLLKNNCFSKRREP